MNNFFRNLCLGTLVYCSASAVQRTPRLDACIQAMAIESFLPSTAVDLGTTQHDRMQLPSILHPYFPKLGSPPSMPTLGVELEGLISRSIGFRQLLGALLPVISESHPGAFINDLETKIEYFEGGSLYTYELTRDSSIQATQTEQGVELVSATMENESALELFLRVVEALVAEGFRADPLSAGLHVNVGFANASALEVGMLNQAFALLQQHIRRWFSTSRNRSSGSPPEVDALEYIGPYTAPIPRSQIELFRQVSLVNLQLEQILAQIVERNLDLNFLSLTSIDTIATNTIEVLVPEEQQRVEFRFPNSTTNIAAIRTIVEFCWRFVDAIRRMDRSLLLYLNLQRHDFTAEDLSRVLRMRHPITPEIIETMATDLRRSNR